MLINLKPFRCPSRVPYARSVAAIIIEVVSAVAVISLSKGEWCNGIGQNPLWLATSKLIWILIRRWTLRIWETSINTTTSGTAVRNNYTRMTPFQSEEELQALKNWHLRSSVGPIMNTLCSNPKPRTCWLGLILSTRAPSMRSSVRNLNRAFHHKSSPNSKLNNSMGPSEVKLSLVRRISNCLTWINRWVSMHLRSTSLRFHLWDPSISSRKSLSCPLNNWTSPSVAKFN